MEFFSKIQHTSLGQNSKLVDEYRPINVVGDNNSPTPFITSDITLNDENLEIILQKSYDDSVNILMSDGENDIRIVNSGFAKIGNNITQTIHRGNNPTNRYDSEIIDEVTQLFIYPQLYPTMSLDAVDVGGQLKCGNYTFYVKYIDDDDNTTDFVCESGIVSIFHGDYKSITSIHGGLKEERTDKLVKLTLTNVDPRFSKIKLYAVRATSELTGVAYTEAFEYVDPIDIVLNENSDKFTFLLTGLEDVIDISIEDLNVQNLFYKSAKSFTVAQDTLFLGNISSGIEYNVEDLDGIAKNIEIKCFQDSDGIGFVNDSYNDISICKNKGEYYNPYNIYNKLGYWPNELYRFGIVYIFKNGQHSQAFQLSGGAFTTLQSNKYIKTKGFKFLEDNGLCLTPSVNIIDYTNKIVKPLAFEFSIREDDKNTLSKAGIIAYYFVRQNRIPNVVAQGLSVGVNRYHGFPMPYVTANSSLNTDDTQKTLIGNDTAYKSGFYKQGLGNVIQGNYFLVESIFQHWNEYFISKWGHYNCWMCGDAKYQLPYDGDLVRQYLPIPSGDCDLTYWFMPIDNDNRTGCDVEYPNAFPGRNGWDNPMHAFGASALCAVTYYGLLCVDTYCIPELQNMFNGSKYYIDADYEYWHTQAANKAIEYNAPYNSKETQNSYRSKEMCTISFPNRSTVSKILSARKSKDTNRTEFELLYIPENTSTRTVYRQNGDKNVFYKYCTKIGSAEDINTTVNALLDVENPNFRQIVAGAGVPWDAPDIVRGNFTPFIAVIDQKPEVCNFTATYETITHTTYFPYTKIKPSTIYNIRQFKSTDYSDKSDYVMANKLNSAPYLTCSHIVNINTDSSTDSSTTIIYRGDCFTNTVTTRLQWGFIDPSVPLQDDFVDALNSGQFKGSSKYQQHNTDASNFNRGDFNAVQLGRWLTYKSLSNYNVGLRSEDRNNPEYAMLGNNRSFFPHRGADRSAANKMPDSSILNLGYSKILPYKKHFVNEEIPYQKVNYTNRIAFSNTDASSIFKNNYRVFQGLQYQDINTEYGAIVKLEEYAGNIFVVFEHGIGLLGVNTKALLSTDVGAEVYISGTGVLDDKITTITQNYGSQHPESIIRTPNGFYGIDLDARKIWKYNNNGFVLISDRSIEYFLNDVLSKSDVKIKTHYNTYKNDIMFVIMTNDEVWNICYNEIIESFTTFYSWAPSYSVNINNTFHSFKNDLDSTNILYEHFSGNVNKMIDPTNWYDKQHTFEFEFIVNDPAGAQKIFDNLSIISNNVEPESLEISLVGDSYILKNINNVTYPVIKINNNIAYQVTTELNKWENTKLLKVFQKSLNIKDFGRRLGNIEYKEDAWYISLQPINLKLNNILSQQKIRDKWAKIRIKYSGEDLAIITAIYTNFRLSYA